MKEISAQQRIVEIGPEMNPIFMMFQNPLFERIGKDVDYTAVDCDPENVKSFKEFYESRGRGRIIQGYVQEIPLPEEYADQIWIMNVFGRFKSDPSYRGDIFKELTRILKRKGTIHIGELYGPNQSYLIERDYSELGLEKRVYRGKDEARDFWKKLGGPVSNFDLLEIGEKEHPFFMELTREN